MNEMQLKAVNSESKKILVLAGAGTGKSTVLLGRIARLIHDGVNPNEIIALTFTNAAACEMKERFIRDNSGDKVPFFGTFHSFCYKLITSDIDVRMRLCYSKIPVVASTADIKRIKTECIQQCGTKLSLAKLEGEIPLLKTEKFQYDIFWKQYNKNLRQSGLITFDIMCYEVCELFTSNDSTILKYKDRLKHIFVDEFQDTDHRQWDFVRSFTNSNIFVVGDVKQELYAFRNADPEIIKSLSMNPEWETIKLSENYRCSNQICEYANAIHHSWGDAPYNLAITGQFDDSPVMLCSAFTLTGFKCQDTILRINGALAADKSVAILCRTNAEVKYTLYSLKQLNIPCRTNNDTNVYGHIVEAAHNPSFAVEWLSGKLNQDEYGKYLKMCSLDESYSTYDRFRSMYADKFKHYFERIESVKSILESDDFAMSKLVRIFGIFKKKTPKIEDSINSTDEVVNFLKTYYGEKSDSSGVYVGTIHSVKGLEYDEVHLIGVMGKSFKLDNEDNLNCFYVGVTRAKSKLYIYYG